MAVKNFSDLLKEKIKEKNLTVLKLSEISQISVKNLENLLSGDFEKMPSAPYLRGYIKRLGEILNFDYSPWWQEIRAIRKISLPKTADALPKNRFAFKSRNWQIIISLAVFILALYFVFNFGKIFGQPSLLITNPQNDVTMSSSDNFLIQGVVKNTDELLINGESENTNPDGSFEKNVILTPGSNAFNFTAKKYLGGAVSVIKTIDFQNSTTTTSTSL
ncbi:MAG: helix-turn-helix domain-containing protein [Patescibacteria group bacterium]|nr:helix-turn-helix domain-containing protein [Patescibacteria group bacterium]